MKTSFGSTMQIHMSLQNVPVMEGSSTNWADELRFYATFVFHVAQ